MSFTFESRLKLEQAVKDDCLDIDGDLIVDFDICIKASIKAKNIEAKNIDAENIKAENIKAENIKAKNTKAENIYAKSLEIR